MLYHQPPEAVMFMVLLLVSFLVSFLVCWVIVKIFRKPLDQILHRLVAEDIYAAWTKYLTFAIYVVGISGGVRVWELNKYIEPPKEGGAVLTLNADRWILEIYKTIIGALQSNAWMLLLFFIFALIAYVISRGIELRKS